MKYLDIGEARPGMILSRDVYSPQGGFLLLAVGTILQKEHIEHLINNDVTHIYVIKDFDNNLQEKFLQIDGRKELNQEYNKIISMYKNLYHDLGLGKKIEIENVKKTVSSLISEVISHDNILTRLRQIENRDTYTFRHSIDVCILSTMIGKWLNYSSFQLEELSISALLHDAGKTQIPDHILNKPGPLTKNEFEIMKKHTILGYEIILEVEGLKGHIAYGALQHHERQDGSGYPYGLKKENIHEFAKIIAVADIFNAMTSKRVYKDKVSPFKVAELLLQSTFGELDPHITRVFLNRISQYYIGNIVRLNSGIIGEIILVHHNMPAKPLIKTGTGYIDLSKEKKYEIVEIIA